MENEYFKWQKLSRALSFVAFFAFFGHFRESFCLWKLKTIKTRTFLPIISTRFFFMRNLMSAKVLIFHLYDVSFRTLGSNPFPCDYSISLLWKDYKGIAELLPNRDIIRIHRKSLPAWFKYAEMMKKRIPTLTKYSSTGKNICRYKFLLLSNGRKH